MSRASDRDAPLTAVSTGGVDAAAAIAGLLGLIIGSFLNVVIYRVPRGMSIVQPGSACPSCGSPVRWYDNVPVVSWLVLRGRCRNCGKPISVQYLLVELAIGMLFAALVLVFAPG